VAGNSRLIGGPEDGTEVDVAWPPASTLRRAHEGQILVYERAPDTKDGRIAWKYTGAEPVVKPGSHGDTRAANDGERRSDDQGTERPEGRGRQQRKP
jgi:hypothetical protein